MILQFTTPDVRNNRTFYTDSEGLEMQKRILDYRPTWDFVGYLNVTQNYYPVNSAIAIRDEVTKNQMTVMNSRSQGGSSLMEGQIELMHHRRLQFDDWRGVGEPLNETDEYGNGIQVTSVYYLHLFNSSVETSQQRPWQLFQDDPVQYFYNFNFQLQGAHFSALEKRLPTTEELRDLGLPPTGKLTVFAQGQN